MGGTGQTNLLFLKNQGFLRKVTKIFCPGIRGMGEDLLTFPDKSRFSEQNSQDIFVREWLWVSLYDSYLLKR